MSAPDEAGLLAKFLDWAPAALAGTISYLWYGLSGKVQTLEKNDREKEVMLTEHKAQIDRLVSDAESEKDTRRRANEAIMAEFKELRKGKNER